MPTARRVVVSFAVLGALVVSGCDTGNLFPVPAPKPAPAPAAGGTSAPTPASGSPGAPVYEMEGPTVPDELFAAVHSLALWDDLGADRRKELVTYLDFRLAGFKFARFESFACGGAQHEMAIFDHEGSGLEFALVPGGPFRMGSPEGEDGRKGDETPHDVVLTKGFLASRTEVTQAAWTKVLGANPSATVGDTLPVETVTLSQASKFARRVRCELPTEAQWEYLCRGSVPAAYPFGASPGAAGDYAWYEANAEGRTHPVGLKKPNAFGLYDVVGNVFEWTADDKQDYPTGTVKDPAVDDDQEHKAVRGGCFTTPTRTLRSAFRFDAHPADKQAILGFRVVKTITVR